MSRPRLLDLFCGAGGAAMGYHRAGFDVVGVDIKPQPHYPFEFHQADAMTYPLDGFDAIHASPPCQPHVKGLRSVNASLGREMRHDDLVATTRERLVDWGGPYVIENVVGAPLIDPVRLCGTGFGLALRRHRLFESPVALFGIPCVHGAFTEPRYWTSYVKGGARMRATVIQVYGNGGERELWPMAMQIDWMTMDELAESIPPAYTEWIGRQLIAYVRAVA